jgi:hypothetical protein
LVLVLLSGCSQKELDTLNEQFEALTQEVENLKAEHTSIVDEKTIKLMNSLHNLKKRIYLESFAEVRGVKKHAVKTTVDMRRLEVEGLPFILEYQDFTQEKLFFYASPKGLSIVFLNERDGKAVEIVTVADLYVITPQDIETIHTGSNFVTVLKELSNGNSVGLIQAVGGFAGMYFESGDEQAISDTLILMLILIISLYDSSIINVFLISL